MASTQAGRDYLAGQPMVLTTLVRSLVQPASQLDQTTIEMVVATLQKLSLKYGHQFIALKYNSLEAMSTLSLPTLKFKAPQLAIQKIAKFRVCT
jgi:hypothetical protein